FCQKLAMVEDKNHETALHYACRFGNREILNQIVDALGPKHLYEIRCKSDLSKLVPRHHHFSQSDFETAMNKHNHLFNCFSYFEKTHPDKRFLNNNKHYSARISDFCNCFTAIENAHKNNQNIF